uniref:Permease n=1 Tax=Magnetococcus massalia (strain MO-1) TaxID=451514 RepID=A0A1S7LGG8_MAGMO|nr:Conserved protein of unknown function. Putative permease [Candidatus Magnetococcus massalia]
MAFIEQFIDLMWEVSPWLMLGLIMAGLVKSWISEERIVAFLGGPGTKPIFWGAAIGAPLPLCSCGVIPMALSLRKSGATKGSTVSFLVSTPETGIDSIALTWILLGPWFTLMRPLSAILCALFAGLLTWWFLERRGQDSSAIEVQENAEALSPPPATPIMPIAGKGQSIPVMAMGSRPVVTAPVEESTSCCASSKSCCDEGEPKGEPETFIGRMQRGVYYAFNDLFDDLVVWLMGGLLLAAMVMTWLPPGELGFLAQWGVVGMVLMVLFSVPIYVCATASTPLAAAMLHAGLSPGMALAFLLAGPASNVATLGVVGRTMGKGALVTYLTGISLGAIACGMAADALFSHFGWQILAEGEGAGHEHGGGIGEVISLVTTLMIFGLTIRYAWRRWRRHHP